MSICERRKAAAGIVISAVARVEGYSLITGHSSSVGPIHPEGPRTIKEPSVCHSLTHTHTHTHTHIRCQEIVCVEPCHFCVCLLLYEVQVRELHPLFGLSCPISSWAWFP